MKDPFAFWEEHGRLDFQQGQVRVYFMGGQYYLFVGQILYASTTERDWYIRNVMPYARGSVLEIGLGLGCASKVILANPKVRKLLTIESSEDVIAAFGRPLSRHHILEVDVNEWAQSVPKDFPIYDLIFVDHYTFDGENLEELEALSKNLVPLLKPGGHMVFWIDEKAPEEDKARIKGLYVSPNEKA